MRKSCGVLLVLALAARAQAADDPQALASQLAAAYKAGDVDAALALFNTANPQAIRTVYVDHVDECFEDQLKDYRCTVSAGPVPDELEQALERHELDSTPAPEGIISVQKKSSTAKPYEHTVAFPYAKVGGRYVITGFQMSQRLLAEKRATTAQSLTDKLFAEGGPYLARGRDPQWKSRAQALPAGGGEPGAALVARTKAMADALAANDVAAMIVAAGPTGRYTYADTADGKPVSLRQRQLHMRARMNYELVDVKVLGGYALDDFAVLTLEGRNGEGWVVRGWKSMRRVNGRWEMGGSGTIDFPPP